MDMNRRTFLQAVAAAPCIFGLRSLLAQECDIRPEWFKQALARMKADRRPGIVLIAPEDEESQLEWGRRLWDLLDEGTPAAHELFLNGVFIVLAPALAGPAGVRKPDEKENRFLLDPDGKRLAADSVDAASLAKPESFVASFAPVLYGKDDERLKARADEAAAAAPPAIFGALSDLGADAIETREKASATLLERAGEFLPLYAHRLRTDPDPEVRSRIGPIVESHFRAQASDAPSARLPFGTRVPKFSPGGCGGMVEEPENKKDRGSRVACGMGGLGNEKVRMFLRFLTK
jgi:hypothetical protein